MLAMTGCGKQLNERFTLWRGDKIPYGTYYAYRQLSSLFTEADIEVATTSPAVRASLGLYGDEENDSLSSHGKRAYLIIGNSLMPSEAEINALYTFISKGNHVFISCTEIGENLLDSLRMSTSLKSGFDNDDDSLTLSILDPVSYDTSTYTYPGKAMDNNFSRMDSNITTILGTDHNGKANFVKFTYKGDGSLYLHLAPAALTNFFLLHKQNKTYYDKLLSFLPEDLNEVYWDDYFRTHSGGESNSGKSSFSKLKAFLANESLSWAFWLAVFLFAIVYLFDSKRKQRVVPEIKLLKNTTLDFVQTIGRLYFQRKDNKNLAGKMSAHFLDHVRNTYNLPTSQLNEAFENRLAYKSGYDLDAVKSIVYQVRTLEDQPVVDDDDLLAFNDKLDKFYKHK
ncbi:MAG: DUF4350 domain-containing protein [Flavitalea sp.]